jgi:tetratricopeptide (TPR) repeat protein
VLGVALMFGSRPRECLFLLIPAIVYLAVCFHASRNVSMRYLLPMAPFLLIGIAAGCMAMAMRVRWLGYVVMGLLVLHGASSLHAFPNYLSYANEMWGGLSQAYKYEPWLDVGQSYFEAKTYLSEHPTANCWLITAWQWDPALYDLPCQTSGLYLSKQVPSRVRGTVILSSTTLSNVRPSEQQLAAAFRGVTPKACIGGSALLVYEGEFDTSLNAAISERNLAAAAFNAGQVESAIEHAERAVQLAPASPLEHGDLCIFWAAKRADLALPECYKARDLLLQDPLKDEAVRKKYLKSLDEALPRIEARAGKP